MNTALTPREKIILEVIKENIRTKGYPPSVREIGQIVGLKSSSTVHYYLKRLEDKGLLRRDPTKPRALELLEHTLSFSRPMQMVPLLGRVAAGEPILAVENQEDVFPLPASFTGEGEFFMLTVRGDSMIEAGILDGDLVVVRRQPSADNGDIVVALLEDEATVKRFFRENDHIRLQPENKAMSPIKVKNPLILGKVVGLLRKL
ncbi:transcriptional repressor LexA [Desulfofundulus thermosubterraneus]|uniref:LexA repressor n=1 Tax=Desulfofundulus thermosubterraneus DSM 16057 TaxID=1121432 RepID=A0A1M6BKH9_9FIRM|nr:transcriptional repressor LexA [Desulfofundulus thermosubterraneus]SHI49167.1 SOS-response transcriptional repressor, LexA [Desulfofundulus thermosubterraneus DSM 16057]